MATVLIIDDDGDFREGLAETLADAGHTVFECDNGEAGLRRLARDDFDLVLLDLRMDGMSGLQVLQAVRERRLAPSTPIVVLTGFADSANTIDAMRWGAFDHLTKPVARQTLLQVTDKALALSAASSATTGTPPARNVAATDTMIGASEAIRQVQKRIGLAANSESPVLITGETGTGKEIVARLLHRHGARSDRPFVAVNCAAIPADLLESELFGHVKGAFSGATSDRPGRFDQADGGVLFMDEIGDMPAAMQAKLLRVLQDQEITPVGGGRAHRVNTRVIAATHHDLARAVAQGRFREDLRFRLDVLRIHLPPLRDRLTDVIELARFFLHQFAPEKGLSQPAERQLQAYAWPGNVRELRNVMARVAVEARGDGVSALDVESAMATASAPPAQPHQEIDPTTAGAADLIESLPVAVARLERRMIEAALQRADGNRAEAARLLGIRRQLLYAKLNALGIETSAED